jgi:recombination associated protein RdgC
MVRAPMPVLRGSITFARFRCDTGKLPQDTRRWLARGLARGAFEPLDPAKGDDDRSAGFVTLEDADSTDFTSGVLEAGRALFAFRVDRIQVKGAAVRAELERWTAAFRAEHDRAPARGEKATAKDEIRHRLRGRTPPSTRVFDVSWGLVPAPRSPREAGLGRGLDAGELLVWAASRKAVDEIAAAIEQAFEVRLAPCSVGAQAARAGIGEPALAPTAALVGLAREEADRGEA